MARFLITLAGCLLTTLAFSHEEAAKEEFFLSTPEQVAALSSEPNYLIGGLVSPLSGHPVLREVDLVVKELRILSSGALIFLPICLVLLPNTNTARRVGISIIFISTWLIITRDGNFTPI